jgi:short subunit dehydrogenase-like uncharacterized protein
MSMAELVTAFRTTGIRNIEAYVEVNPVERAALGLAARLAWLVRNPLCQIALQTQAELLPDGPSDDDRRHCARTVVVEAEDRRGRTVCSRVVTPEAYRFTAVTALTIAGRVLRDEFQPGFRTPAQAYGADFVLGLEGVRLKMRWREHRYDSSASNAAASRMSRVWNPSVKQPYTP